MGKTMTMEQIVTELFGSHWTVEELKELEKSVKILIEADGQTELETGEYL